jgi:hypothetical protein
VLVSEDPIAAFHLVAEHDKNNNASTKALCSEAVMEIDAPWCPEVGAPLGLHYMLEDVE